ncbi:hypothetical protein PAPYR_9897 [Paratrimastix pyriformis]|uniref:Uncharacterized protein n=1 Tax=Paratrimastix pyriformis TaxID=342808 RepID=A0ABQ8U752_9EUKA|nr:hypothetical protein PAPYR_9897 [Paratrimastix pyriformis]
MKPEAFVSPLPSLPRLRNILNFEECVRFEDTISQTIGSIDGLPVDLRQLVSPSAVGILCVTINIASILVKISLIRFTTSLDRNQIFRTPNCLSLEEHIWKFLRRLPNRPLRSWRRWIETELHRAVERVRDLAQRLDEAAVLHLVTRSRPLLALFSATPSAMAITVNVLSPAVFLFNLRLRLLRPPPRPPHPTSRAPSSVAAFATRALHMVSLLRSCDLGLYHPENNGAPRLAPTVHLLLPAFDVSSSFALPPHRLPLSVADGIHAVRGTRLTCGFSKPVHHRLGFLTPVGPVTVHLLSGWHPRTLSFCCGHHSMLWGSYHRCHFPIFREA